jgi:hypothetical protein
LTVLPFCTAIISLLGFAMAAVARPPITSCTAAAAPPGAGRASTSRPSSFQKPISRGIELPNANNDVSCGTECMSVIFSAAETAVVAVTVSKSAANENNLDIETSGFREA